MREGKKMENEIVETDAASFGRFGDIGRLLIAPIAILIALVGGMVFGVNIDLNDFVVPLVVLGCASLMATAPIFGEKFIGDKFSSSLISAIYLLITIVVGSLVANFFGGVVGFLFSLIAIVGFILVNSDRNEEYVKFTFSMVGLYAALGVSGHAESMLPEIEVFNSYSSDLNGVRGVSAEMFFTFWLLMTSLGFIAAILQRGILISPGKGSWFTFLPSPESGIKPVAPLLVALSVWSFAHILTLLHFCALGSVSEGVVEDLGLTGEQMRLSGMYVSVWWALFTGIFALIAAFFYSERWFTRSMLLGVTWVLFSFGRFQEQGFLNQFVAPDDNGDRWTDLLNDGIGMWLWLGITFFSFVLVFYISTHQKYGNKMNRTIGDLGQARKFWNANWSSILIATAFITALTIRVVWNVLPAMNALGTGGWDLTGGSDPWYMKRAIDYVIAEQAHCIFDADRAYPIGDINPRPPLYTWSLALGGLILSPILGMSAEQAVWWSIGALPAIYGALIVFPVAGMAREVFGKGASVLAAWLIAFMPGHVSHTTFALADHDAFVLLFATVGFYYYIQAMKNANEDRVLSESGWNPAYMIEGFTKVWDNQRLATSYAILSGVSFAIVALAWKGFVYAPSILFVFYMIQILFNLFRRRDSMTITVLTVTMLLALWLTALPFYMHPALGLLLNGEFQAMFYITGLIVISGYIVCSARDKPWLMVIGTVSVLVLFPLFLLWLQWVLDYSDIGATLFTGGGYFSQNKIFGTIAEAQAPSRGLLFGSFGAFVFVAALCRGLGLTWDGLRHRKLPELVLAVWVLLASYMAWNAGRFVYNATPVMAIVSAGAFAWLWKISGWDELVKQWRRMGINTPSARYKSGRKTLFRNPGFIAIFMIFIMVFSQHATYGMDAAIPRGSEKAADVDEELYNIIPDFLRWTNLVDGTAYEDIQGYWFMNSFGPGFNDYYWNSAYDWLAQQDQFHEGVTDSSVCVNDMDGTWDSELEKCLMKFSDKPAFVSWWDYGFQALTQGQHPTVADNFQTGIPTAGNMLLSRSQDDTVAMFIIRIGIGDVVHGGNGDDYSKEFKSTLLEHMSTDEYNEYHLVTRELTQELAKDRMFEVYEWTEETTNQGILALARGYVNTDGLKTDDYVWRIYEGEVQIGEDYSSEVEARSAFEDRTANREVLTEYVDDSTGETFGASHYVVGDYWYTADIIEKYKDTGTSIHRQNSQIALGTQVLTGALDSETLNDLYSDIISLDIYEVQDSEGAPGEMITRNHEISYFAIDTRLYPMGGGAYSDSSYNRGNPTGIFYAPTILSGQNPDHFMDTVYETQRGSESIIERTAEDFNEQYKMDVLRSQSGGDVEVIQLVDVRYDHTEAFYDTMLARAYIGYGAADLGLTDYSGVISASPKPLLSSSYSGTPESVLESAWPLPGAMMNHFVISNWYDERGNYDTFGLGEANFGVKVLKYYAGAEVCGTVSVPELDTPIAGATLLVERDGFSGEGVEDLDARTYWIPIGTTTTDSDGNYCFTAPAGRIRVTALTGEFDSSVDLMTIQSGELDIYSMNIDIIGQNPGERVINPITGLLSEVSGMMWLGENEINVTANQAERISTTPLEAVNIELETSSATGVVKWVGDGEFDGLPLVETDFVLQNLWNDEISYNVSTINKTVSGEDLVISGVGTAVYSEHEGIIESAMELQVTDFTGNYSRRLQVGQSYTGNGTWSGQGVLDANWVEGDNISACENSTVAEGEDICSEGSGKYLINGTAVGSGRFTADVVTEFTNYLTNATFEAGGKFVGTGTFEGEATYTGLGDYSGEMVVAGSFYANDIAPGEYKMYAVFNNGRTSDVIEKITVGLDGSKDLDLSIAGLKVSGIISDEEGNSLNTTVEIIDLDLESNQCTEINLNEGIWVDESGSLFSPGVTCLRFSSGEEGNVSIGPLSPGNYSVRVDLDGDNHYELNTTLVEEDQVLSFDGEILDHGDVEFTISPAVRNETTPNQPDIINVNEILVSFTSVENGEVINATSNESGVVFVELPLGDWIMKSRTGENLLLWSEFSLEQDDLNLDLFEFSKAVSINGYVAKIVTDVENGTQVPQPLTSLPVNFRSGSIEVIVETNESGEFELELPSGMEFDVTTLTPDNMVAAKHVNVSSDMENVNLIINEKLSLSYNYAGRVILNPNNVTYDNKIPDFENFEVFAEYVGTQGDQSLEMFMGVTWVSTVDSDGRYDFVLPTGNYSITVSEEMLGVPETILSANQSVGTTIEALNWTVDAYPDPVAVQIRTFIDGGDELFENGTPVSVDFRLIPVGINQETINITSEMFTEDGILDMDLSFGQYYLEMDAQNVKNGSEFDTIFAITPDPISIGVSGIEDPIDLVLQSLWKVDIEIKEQNFAPAENVTVVFDYTDSENFLLDLRMESDSNGTILDYVPAGNYTVTIGPYDVEGTTQSFRALVHIDSNSENRTFEWRTLEVANLNLTLLELVGISNHSLLKGVSLTSVSNDGLGEVTLPLSNQTAIVSAQLYPGDWSLKLNYTDEFNGVRWILDEYALGDLSENETIDADIELSRYVEISGNVYWDFNEDGEYQTGEELDESEVKLDSEEFESLNMTTGSDGKWSFYVPANNNYTINVSRLGFTYNNTLIVEVENTSINKEDLDVSLDADTVFVSGKIDIQYGFESLSDDIITDMSVELIPAADEGYERENVDISISVNEDGDIVWNATVAPGKWVFHAEAPSFHMVVYDAFEAEIIDGGEHNTTIKAGGYLPISTRWTDFSGDERDVLTLESTNSTITGLVPLTLTLNEAKWNITVSETAEIWLLPAGSLQISGEFTALEMEMEMEYVGDTISGAYPPGFAEDGSLAVVTSAEAVVEFNRVLTHDVEFSITQISSNNEIIDYVEDEMINATVRDLNGDGITDEYYDIEVSIDITYAGNLASENYTFMSSVSVSDKDDWLVTFEVGDTFEDIKNMSLGISESPSNGELLMKIKLPSGEDSISYETGHNIRIIATSTSGHSSNFDLKVHIPQDYSIEATGPDVVGMTSGGGTTAFDIKVDNLGNGDDNVFFEIDSSELPDGWSVSEPMSRVIPANGTSDVGFTVTMPEFTFEGSYTIIVNVTSESGIMVPVNVLVQVAEADLRMDTPSMGPGGGIIHQPVDFSILVHNDGLISAEGVTVTGYIEELNITAVSLPITILPESNETITVLFDTDEIGAGEYKFTFTIDAGETPLIENPEPVELNQVKFTADNEAKQPNIVPIIIVLVFALGIYSFIKSRRTGSGPGF